MKYRVIRIWEVEAESTTEALEKSKKKKHIEVEVKKIKKACEKCIKAYRLNDRVEEAKEIGDECYWCCKKIIITDKFIKETEEKINSFKVKIKKLK